MKPFPLSIALSLVAGFSVSLKADANTKQLYADLVAPVLMAKCAGCHGEEKQKGKLRIDSFEAILKGGSEGESVIVGNVDESSLIQRVYLPLDDDEHMPPEGKDQLSAQETAMIAFWIKSGAKEKGTVAELKPDAEAAKAIAHVADNLPEMEVKVAKADQPKADPAKLKLIADTIASVEKSGASLMAIAQDTPELRFSALNVSKEYSDDQIALLKPVAGDIKWIDLARTKVTDKGLAHLAGMKNLERLHLENTAITDAGLDSLKELTNLEYLNLYNTGITDAGLAKLSGLKKLKKLFVWQSKVTDAGAAKFAAAIPGVDVNTGWKEPKAEPVKLAAAAPAKPTTPAPTAPAKPAAKPAPKPATPAPTTPAPKPATPAPKPAPKPAPAGGDMFNKALAELQGAAAESAKKAIASKAEFDAAIKEVAAATKKAEALKASSEKAAKVAAETKAALTQLEKAIEASK
ncbi:c-type cytochrome domain-containing protein [Verrucomicrobiales bacterium BCK34]|nr:c-type cytochrome domain-containing protein [Verrucomicrobiales bacterium BCK34]